MRQTSCQKLFIGIMFFQRWEDLCCKMSPSLCKLHLSAPPSSLSFLSLGPWLHLPSPPRTATLLEEKLVERVMSGQEGVIPPGGTATQAGDQSEA